MDTNDISSHIAVLLLVRSSLGFLVQEIRVVDDGDPRKIGRLWSVELLQLIPDGLDDRSRGVAAAPGLPGRSPIRGGSLRSDGRLRDPHLLPRRGAFRPARLGLRLRLWMLGPGARPQLGLDFLLGR